MTATRKRLIRGVSLVALVGVIGAGIAVFTSEPAEARPRPGPPGPPGPMCGPTILWECTFPDGSTQHVGATRCEIAKFEKKNKATCEPSSG